MENNTTDHTDQNQRDWWEQQYANMGPREHEMLHHWKKRMWHKMKMAKCKADSMWGNELSEDAKMKMYKGLGVAALIGFGVGMLLGKGSKRG